MDVIISIDNEFMQTEHEYPDICVRLTVFNARISYGTPILKEHNDLKWIDISEADQFQFCPADIPVLQQIAKSTEGTLIRVDDGVQPYRPGDPIPPEMEARVNAYREKVAQYTLSLSVFKQLFRESPDLFGEEEWKQAEAVLAEKYGLPDNSIFRQKELPVFKTE